MSDYHIELRGVRKRLGGVEAVAGLDLRVRRGELLSILGPSGCGKTTTLNMIAGFLQPDEGTILIDGKPVERLSPRKRNLGMVFQSYALFPHLTVAKNVAFGLRMRRVPHAEMTERVEEALHTTRLDGLGDRYPKQLSGGQQQRVALARALVIRPTALLLDEPLSNLDAKLRNDMRLELRAILNSTGITTIFVTHDQSEALGLSDRVAVMNQGKLEQLGEPWEVYNSPASRFAATFLGDINVLTGTVERRTESDAIVRIGETEVRARDPDHTSAGRRVEMLLRPERIVFDPPPECVNRHTARLRQAVFLGTHTLCTLEFEGQVMSVLVPNAKGAVQRSPGDPVAIGWDGDACTLRPVE